MAVIVAIISMIVLWKLVSAVLKTLSSDGSASNKSSGHSYFDKQYTYSNPNDPRSIMYDEYN